MAHANDDPACCDLYKGLTASMRTTCCADTHIAFVCGQSIYGGQNDQQLTNSAPPSVEPSAL